MNVRNAGYWSTTILIALAFMTGGAAYLLHLDAPVQGMAELGYPAYVVSLLGAWKLLGGIAILAPRLSLVKEWAYAGIAFDLTGAAFSHAAAGHPAVKVVVPLVLLGILAASWALRPASRRLGATRGESLHPIGHIASTLRALDEAPRQGSEGAPDAWLEVDPSFARGLSGIAAGDEAVVVTWLHRADRDVLEVHPRNDPASPLAGVFATRSPHRPNPLGLHRVTVREISGTRLRIGPIESIDGTPVIDIKAALATG